MDNVTLHIDWTSVYTCCVSHFSVDMAIQSKNVSAEMMHVWRAWQVGVKIMQYPFLFFSPAFKIAPLESLQLNRRLHIHLSV